MKNPAPARRARQAAQTKGGTAGTADDGGAGGLGAAGVAADSGSDGTVNEAGAGGSAGQREPPLTCSSGLSACGGVCVDPTSDGLNCGACAHSCLGGACTLGTCGAVQIEKDQGRLFTVSVDSQYVYWGGDNAAIAKKRLDGTGITTVLVPYGSQEDSYDSVLAGNELFWGNDWHRLCRRAKDSIASR